VSCFGLTQDNTLTVNITPVADVQHYAALILIVNFINNPEIHPRPQAPAGGRQWTPISAWQ
jgi:hypothetical protein